MQFILFLDEVGAECTKARSTSKDVVASARGKLLRFRPKSITPLEVIEEKGAGRRAAGGFILLGPLGAALGVLTGKGQQVLFELTDHDGTVHKGIIAQSHYLTLRQEIERIQIYKPGKSAQAIAMIAGFLLLLVVCLAATGPAGLIIAPVLWFGICALLALIFGKKAAT